MAEDTTFTTSHFSGSGNCSLCHDDLTDTAGDNVSIVKDWGTSMMANASKDPLWQAKVATELSRNPQLSSLINDKCTKCHMPMANYEINKVQNGELTLFGADGVLDPSHAEHDAAMNGVSCTLCHQVTDDATLGTLEGFSGQYKINDTKTIYGQYSNITAQPMINNTGYTPTFGAHISDSAVCGSCHNLKTPFVDEAGNVLTTSPESEFPEQMPYTEWQNSIFDDAGSNPQSCQDCHMPKTTSKVANRPRFLVAKPNFAKHHLVGANTVMLTLLKNNAAQLDVTSPDLDLSINRARAMLQSSVQLSIASASVKNGLLDVTVNLQNNSGHKVPTAYPSRRMWLNFKVIDSSNNVVFESGRSNADGSVVNADNDIDRTVFEPHYNLITQPDQVQVYETIMADSKGDTTYTLLRGAQYLKDNRLTPRGFDKSVVPSDVAVHGQAATDENFNLGNDDIRYQILLPSTGEFNIHVALNYQTIAHGFLQDLYSESQLPQVQSFKNMYDAQSLKFETITFSQTSVIADIIDPDADGIPSSIDNCPELANPNQVDTDTDSIGDACDLDDDNDGLTDSLELLIGTSTLNIDTDNDDLSDYDEVNFDGDPENYTPLQDLNPLTADTDNDGLGDATDPMPLIFNFADGDLAPVISPDGVINAADHLICQQLILGMRATTDQNLSHGDIYPVNEPDGIINIQDCFLLRRTGM